MPKVSINDLKTTNESTGTGIANPEIELGAPEPIVLGVPGLTPPAPTKRTIADLSSLPTKEEDLTGIDVKRSVEDEIFKPGGEFEDYLKEKASDMSKLYESIDAHNREVAEALGEEVPEEITDADIIRSQSANLNLEEDDKFDIDDEEYVDELEKELSDDIEDDKEVQSQVKIPVPVVKEMDIEKPEEVIDPASVSFDIDDEDIKELGLDEDDDEDSVDEDEDEILKQLQAQISEKISPVSKNLNISSFTRVNKPVKVSKVIDNIEKRSADWALMNSGTRIGMSSFSGTDLDNLGNTDGLARISIVNKRYKLFYDHIISEHKPESMMSFVKSTSYVDNDNLYMAAYIASFAGANYLPIDCPKCKNTFLTDDLPIDSMYKFSDDETKERFMNIIGGNYGEINELYVTEAVPISDQFCFVFREPSIYKILFETSYLDDRFSEKYRGVISVLSYIDEILIVDTETKQLAPVWYKRFPENNVKDIKSRVIEYSKIINNLTADQYNIVVAYINAINQNKGTISYQIPEVVCPKCGHVIPAQPITAEGLVFMRHQLAALATTSIK